MNTKENQANSRRDFLKLSALVSVMGTLPNSVKAGVSKITKGLILSNKPIGKIAFSDYQGKDFNGDNIDLPHDVLWNLDGFLAKNGGIPYPTESRKVIVVGGGMSGLISSYYLKGFNPLVLEQDKAFGGNSKGEEYKDTKYSIGAAYICIPDEGSEIDQFLKDINILGEFRHEAPSEMKFAMKKKAMGDFWKGTSDPARASEFIAMEEELRRIYDSAYPDIPWSADSAISKEEYNYLDSITFQTWLDRKFGVVHPHILEYFQLYCWSSFTGSIDELSALQVLNFVCSEVDGILALPGGNAAITERLYDILDRELSPNSLRSSAFVLKIKKQSNGKVWVSYLDSLGVIKTVECEACIVASAKYVAKRIIEDIPALQEKQMSSLLYRGYLVGNAIYPKRLESLSYDIFCFEGKMPESPTPSKPNERVFADIIYGAWAQNDQTENGVLTIYKPLAYDGARQFLFSPFAHDKHQKAIRDEVNLFAKSFGIQDEMLGLRLTRWGHSLPIALKGLLSTGYLENMNRPIGGKIFFANQDNYANPAFETAFTASLEAVKEVFKVVKR